MSSQWLQRRKIRKALSGLVSNDAIEEAIDELLSKENAEDDFGNLKEGTIDFIVAAVCGETSEIIAERMGIVADIASKHGGFILSLVSSLVIITYGMFPQLSPSNPDRVGLAQALSRELGENIKIVHGRKPGHYGIVGKGARTSFSFFVPGFLGALALLAEIDFGETRET